MKAGDCVEVLSTIGLMNEEREAARIMVGNTWMVEKISFTGFPVFTITNGYHRLIEIRLPPQNVKLI